MQIERSFNNSFDIGFTICYNFCTGHDREEVKSTLPQRELPVGERRGESPFEYIPRAAPRKIYLSRQRRVRPLQRQDMLK